MTETAHQKLGHALVEFVNSRRRFPRVFLVGQRFQDDYEGELPAEHRFMVAGTNEMALRYGDAMLIVVNDGHDIVKVV